MKISTTFLICKREEMKMKYQPLEIDLAHEAQYCTSVQHLAIRSCPKITSIPIPSEGLPSLGRLGLLQCPELSSLPSGLGCCTSLVDLSITKCPMVTSIPIGSLCTTLRSLRVDNPESLPILHGGFTSLRQLVIDGCQSTQIDLQFSQILVSLEDLGISDCPNLETVPSLDKLTSLRGLWIRDCSRLTCLPSGLAISSPHVFTRLKYLQIVGCGLETVPLQESDVSTFRPSYATPHQIRFAIHRRLSPFERKMQRGERPRVA